MEINEKYFMGGGGANNAPRNVDELLSQDEKILWRGKPKKNAFILNSVVKLMPFALLWLIFDGLFIGVLCAGEVGVPAGMAFFLIFFFILHLAPVWMWVYKCVTASRRHKNTEYVFTDKRVIVRTGTIALDYKNVYYADIEAVNLRYGVIDRLTKVGDVYITSNKKATVLEDIENPQEIERMLEEIISDKKSGVAFTCGAKVRFVKCPYCGRKNKSTDRECVGCGAPIEE